MLGRGLPALEAEAAARVQAHFAGLGRGGEAWVADGMHRIAGASAGHEHAICPFCAQSLAGSPLIAHYQAYFSEAYGALRKAIEDQIVELTAAQGGEVVAAFERAVAEAVQRQQFWSRFTEVDSIPLDTAAIALARKTAFEAVAGLLRQKQSAPLEARAVSAEANAAVAVYERARQQVHSVDAALQVANSRVAIVKESAAAADIPALIADLQTLTTVKARHTPAVAAMCDDYLRERTTKAGTEALRDAARTALDQYRNVVFPAYQDAINIYLTRLNAGFRLDSVASVNIRSGSTVSYSVLINQVAVPLAAANPGEPSFRNTLSAGDRNALALGFFFASLDRDPNRSAKIVVIDDPMTSLDEHRSLTTVQEMRRLADEVAQVIVLSHSKPFLCALWEGTDPSLRSAMRIVRSSIGSTLTAWDVTQDCVTEHDRRHALVSQHIQNSVGVDERAVAAALRPILEAFMRVAYPRWFPPGELLGPFIGLSQPREGTADQILSPADRAELRRLLDYANLFHHDTNAAWQTVIINDHELLDFSRRTIAFARRS